MKKIFFLMSFFFCYTAIKAQYYYDRSRNPDKVVVTKSGSDYDKFFYLLWDSNSPISNPGYIDEPSAIGLKIGLRKRINNIDGLWIGGEFGWAVYQKHVPYTTYTYGTQTISAEVYNYSYNNSLTFNVDYFLFSMDKKIVPYGGLGVGVALDKFSQYYNIYSGSVSTVGALVRPEVGLLIGLKENSAWRIKAGFHFDYASNSANLVNNNFITPANDNYSGFLNTGFQIGIVKMVW